MKTNNKLSSEKRSARSDGKLVRPDGEKPCLLEANGIQ